MASLAIAVTVQDIEQGRRFQSSGCPIALAAQRAVGPGTLVFVAPAILVVRDLEGDTWYSLPSAARSFQERFDRATWDDVDSHVDPISFEATLIPRL